MLQKAPDLVFMQRAIALSLLGFGKTRSNPLVGCVVVHKGEIIGEGYHAFFGGPHAEVNAIQSVHNKERLQEATLYVTLEPCCHFGKTPPCTDLILAHKIPRVVVANLDPFPEVSGKGIARLQSAGVEVVTGLAEEEAAYANRRFLTAQLHKRPFVIAKWAETSNGIMASAISKQISGKEAQTLLHQWRSQETAFLVGKGTFMLDNPLLTNRLWGEAQPMRVVLANGLRVADNPGFFEQPSPILLYGNALDSEDFPQHVTCIPIDAYQLEEVLLDLFLRGITSLVVEGGRNILDAFLALGFVDEIRVLKSKKTIWEKGVLAPDIPVWFSKHKEELDLNTDRLFVYSVNRRQ
jgi:diaminohydroxyphosphoribosylaminopyrimidine deaminase/5-amino-6-(5-phosphoribosylamino)uracil reductase